MKLTIIILFNPIAGHTKEILSTLNKKAFL